MPHSFIIERVAVLGAGVMGAQIAAHCVNAGFPTLLFDLASEAGSSNAIVEKAIRQLATLKPMPLATADTASLIQIKNYDEHLEELSACCLVIEAIAERLDWKEALYKKISPYLASDAILVTNTSGLSIEVLAQSLPKEQRARFCGVHFFNPPRYMHLIELIPSLSTPTSLLDDLETWLTRFLGKGIIRAKDTPNFIANRVGVFSLLATIHHAARYGIAPDVVDALTGPLIGRPKSATFRTLDVVGLDTMAHVIKTMQEQLISDPWHAHFKLPHWLEELIKAGHLGQKVGQGIYRKQGKAIEVYNAEQKTYVSINGVVSEAVQAIMTIKDPQEKMQRLFTSEDTQAQFLTACLTDLFHYAAFHLEIIAHSTRDVDLALRFGFGWQQGPFETWQDMGLSFVLKHLEQYQKNSQLLAKAPFPQWLYSIDAFYTAAGSFSPLSHQYIRAYTLPVYKRQFFPPRGLGEKSISKDIWYENDAICLWRLTSDVAVISFKSKANSISQAVIDGCHEALDKVHRQCQGIIIYQDDANCFSAGANLQQVAELIRTHQLVTLENMIKQFQQLMMRIKYSPIPIVAALRGKALGGGCELMMHCCRTVAAFESYPGLVETGVGLIPAGGGTKEMALRASQWSTHGDLMTYIQPFFEQLAMARVASSAKEALNQGYLQKTDTIIMHREEVLYTALATVRYLQESNYHPPLSTPIKIAGREGKAMLEAGLINWLEGGFISKNDYLLATELAHVLCGGDAYEGQLVDEKWLLSLERMAFMKRAEHPSTELRIMHLLETGKPLRN